MTPASPEGVAFSSPGTTVMAVTVDLLPLGRTVVWMACEVVSFLIVVELGDEDVELEAVADCDDEATVLAPPPIVVTTTTPEESVFVTTEPLDWESWAAEEVVDLETGVSDVAVAEDGPVLVDVIVVGGALEPGNGVVLASEGTSLVEVVG